MFVGSKVDGLWSGASGGVGTQNLIADLLELGKSDFAVGESAGAVAANLHILGHAPAQLLPVDRSSHTFRCTGAHPSI